MGNVWFCGCGDLLYYHQVTAGTGVTSVAAELKKFDQSRKFTYEELKKGTPEGVDPSCKEV